MRDTYRDGFWEPDVNRALRDKGYRLLHSPELVVYQGRSAGFRAFVRQRLVHGRAYGRQRGVRFSRGRNAVGIAAAVLVPFVLLARTAREVFSRGRLRGRLLALAARARRVSTSRGQRERPPGIWIASVVDDGSRALGRDRVGERPAVRRATASSRWPRSRPTQR